MIKGSYWIFLAWMIAGAACFSAACTHRETKKDSPTAASDAVTQQKPVGFVHTVRWNGETLTVIAKWYTGSTENWKRIAAANPSIQPNCIRLGDTISIPEELVTNRNPLTEDFVRRFNKKSRQPESNKQPAADDTEALELFGPKQKTSK